MFLFEKIFRRRTFAFEIIVPNTIEIIHMNDKVRFRGKREDISSFAKQFYQLKELRDGQLCKLDKYVLKVSDLKTEDSYRKNWIELPGSTWAIIASKFREVPEFESSPFDFNDCGYIKMRFDIGVEVTDQPLL